MTAQQEIVRDQLRGSLALTEEPMTTTLAKQERADIQANPSGILGMALASGTANIETLTKLLELQERWEATEARKAFNAAMAAFKADPPKIVKAKKVAYKDTKYSHASLGDACELIGDALSRHGLSHRWDVRQEAGAISVSCILTHVLGHSERVTLQSLPDESGGKNKIQAIGSAVTYLQRYTLFAATGIAPEDDDDGKGTEGTKEMDREELDRLLGLIGSAPNNDTLKTKYMAALKDANDIGDTAAIKKFEKAKNSRYRELNGDPNAGR